jgi:hypothetical protein
VKATNQPEPEIFTTRSSFAIVRDVVCPVLASVIIIVVGFINRADGV